MGYKITNVPLILKIWDFIFLFLGKLVDNLEGQKVYVPLKISHKVICPQKK
jgi:hypothetical protein